jgi:hypothetical protein
VDLCPAANLFPEITEPEVMTTLANANIIRIVFFITSCLSVTTSNTASKVFLPQRGAKAQMDSTLFCAFVLLCG